MKCNVGGWDRNVRLILGASALLFGIFGPLRRRARAVAISFGASELVTGLARYCPVNEALGVNTARPRTKLDRAMAELTA